MSAPGRDDTPVSGTYLHASQHRVTAQALAHAVGGLLNRLGALLAQAGDDGTFTASQRDQLALARATLALAQMHATLGGEPR